MGNRTSNKKQQRLCNGVLSQEAEEIMRKRWEEAPDTLELKKLTNIGVMENPDFISYHQRVETLKAFQSAYEPKYIPLPGGDYLYKKSIWSIIPLSEKVISYILCLLLLPMLIILGSAEAFYNALRGRLPFDIIGHD